MSLYPRYYDVVRRIPAGRVATYGTIARVAGRPGAARQVGYALAALGEGHDDVPWHRVINARGRISDRGDPSGSARVQRILLEDEGVVFDARGRIDLAAFGWP